MCLIHHRYNKRYADFMHATLGRLSVRMVSQRVHDIFFLGNRSKQTLRMIEKTKLG